MYGALHGSMSTTRHLRSGMSQKWCKILERSCKQKSNRLLHRGFRIPEKILIYGASRQQVRETGRLNRIISKRLLVI